jgi:prepilin-type N-terminal cleavage/methylation domain-containing protein
MIQKLNRGFAFIEIILVLVVIAMLSGYYFSKGSPEQQAVSQYQYSMDKSKATACIASRSAMRGAIMTYSMQNPGKPLTKENLAADNIRIDNICPEHGQITINSDGTLSCSIHKP